MPPPRRTRRPLLALLVLLALLIAGYVAQAVSHHTGHRSQPIPGSAATHSTSAVLASGKVASTSGVGVPLSSLPAQAAQTVALIRAGGPFPYQQDGVVFGNRERRLPVKASGFYHEYTVRTPGSPDRGARRMIVGSDGAFFYTADHYDSFIRVDVGR